jgi:hypothetical protein
MLYNHQFLKKQFGENIRRLFSVILFQFFILIRYRLEDHHLIINLAG